jgi:hypothetical protein
LITKISHPKRKLISVPAAKKLKHLVIPQLKLSSSITVSLAIDPSRSTLSINSLPYLNGLIKAIIWMNQGLSGLITSRVPPPKLSTEKSPENIIKVVVILSLKHPSVKPSVAAFIAKRKTTPKYGKKWSKDESSNPKVQKEHTEKITG